VKNKTRIGTVTRRNILFAAALCFQSLWGAVRAPLLSAQQEISVTAEVSARRLTLQSSAQLTVTITGAQNADPLEFPEIEGFDAQYNGPSRRLSVVNGHYTASISFTYTLFPKKEGEFEIPPLNVKVDGRQFSTGPILMRVESSSSADAGPSFGPGESRGLEDRVRLELRLPYRDVYVNQLVPVTVRLYVAGVSLGDIQYPRFDETGYRTEAFSEPRRYDQVIDGTRYEVLEFNSVLYPTRTGEVKIGPAKLAGHILYRAENGGPRDRFDSLFDDPFFSGFFGVTQKRPVEITSETETLNVLDVPENGRPDNFSGAVGVFTFQADVSPRKVQAGDPLTLRMRISGDGNLAGVRLPEMAENGEFRTYSPIVTSEQGGRIIEQVIIPVKEEINLVPALEFHYFDPRDREFKVIRQGPFPVTVDPAPEGRAVFTSDPGAPPEFSEPDESYGKDIVYLKSRAGDLRKRGGAFYRHPLYFIYWVVLLVLGAGGAFLIKYRRRLEEDPAFAARISAPKAARQDLRNLQRLLDNGDPGEFYDSLFQTLQNYFSRKWQLPAGEISPAGLREHAFYRRMEKRSRMIVCELFELCESVRFSSRRRERQEMREDYRKVEALINESERRCK
jgi:hypothetical protein